MRRDQLNPHKTATFVMPGHKSVYVSVNKAACTSCKWLVADLQGEDAESFYSSISREVSREMCIHRRSIFRHTPMLHLLPDEELAEIGPERGWFIFAIVRHPAARLFSGWQSKFLLGEPRWVEMYADASWFPRPATTTTGVIEDFHRFVHAMADDPPNPLMRDRHFMSQTRMLRPDHMPYSRIYDTTEIPRMLEDLDAHLRRQGWSGDLRMRQTNETPLRPLAAMFPDDVQAAIGTLLGADLERFGYGEIVPPKLHGADEYPASAFDEIARLVERNERIGDLASRAQQMRRELRTQRGAAPAGAEAEHDVHPLHRVRRRLANAIRR